MNKELYVSSTPHETKVALVEDDQLAEVFFERENEYTLAGSIYKGRVTRVLPGMQSAFVDIGLERDAFLYVSDFLELSEEDEDGEFGEIPAPRGAIELGKPQLQESQPAETQTAASVSAGEDDADLEPMFDEEAPAPMEGQAESTASEEQEEDGARPWRGRRRRRGGRRGRGNERSESAPETQTAPPEEPAEPRPEARYESRPRQDYAPPAGYTPIILPGESISKYRNLSQPAAETQAEVEAAPVPVEDILPAEHAETAAEYTEEIAEEAIHLDQGLDTTETESTSEASAAPEQTDENASREVEAAPVAEAEVTAETEERPRRGRRWGLRRKANVAAAEEAVAAPEQPATETQSSAAPESHEVEHPDEPAVETPEHHVSESPLFEREHLEANVSSELQVAEQPSEAEAQLQPVKSQAQETGEVEAQHEVDTPAGSFDLVEHEHHAAPSVAPEGRTLEHEVLEDEEAEFQPVPNDLTAMREVAGDEELVLEEETLDRENGYAERWVPKIEDVDEDEIVAAEERGEKIYEAEEEEEDEESESEEEEVADRAEIRASAPTAGYQQRNVQRPGYERRPGYRDRGRRGGSRRNNVRTRGNRHQPLITDLLKEGQEVLIQIAKEPIGKKGARITSHIALPGRFLVYMPTVNHVGVSRKINSDEERQRLKRIVTSERENGLGGFIVRTAAANIKEEDLRADIRFLKHLWHEIKDRAENSKSPALIYHDLNLVERVLRDQVNADFSQIWVDTEDEYERVVRFANRFQPSLVRRIKLYTKDTPLYEQFGIQEEINRSLKSKVWLKSGGHIVINQTEALVAIDVNTGKYVGKTQRLEDTIVKTNVDAIKEIVRQIRLRDLGGIIVIDFIDMDERKNRQKVMMALEEALRNDRAPSKVLQFNDFGLVAITRKRVKQSLERTLGESCPYCTGAGFVKSVPTVANELYIEMRKMTKVHDKDDITLRVNPEVAKYLKANNGKLITELEDLTDKTVLVKSDPALHQENFDIH
jgi:ribonuclease G